MPASISSPSRRSSRLRSLAYAPVLASALASAPACGSDSLKPDPLVDDPGIYYALDLDHHVVVLSTTAPYDTATLVATPRSARGDALAGLPAPAYRSTDVTKVLVTPEGRLTAVEVTGQPVWVTATLTAGNLKHVDSLRVYVVDDPAPTRLATLSAHPLPPDSAKVAASPSLFSFVRLLLPVRMTDSAGAPVLSTPRDSVGTLVPVSFRSSDPTIAQIDEFTGRITGQKPGRVTFYAGTRAFGVAVADTVEYQVGWPVLYFITVTRVPTRDGDSVNVVFPEQVRVGKGALVFWNNAGVGPGGDITFADAGLPNVAAPSTWAATHTWELFGLPYADVCSMLVPDCTGGGNTKLWETGAAARVFAETGVYDYRSDAYGFGGRVIVVEE